MEKNQWFAASNGANIRFNSWPATAEMFWRLQARNGTNAS